VLPPYVHWQDFPFTKAQPDSTCWRNTKFSLLVFARPTGLFLKVFSLLLSIIKPDATLSRPPSLSSSEDDFSDLVPNQNHRQLRGDAEEEESDDDDD
jgi:hypothetical protein